jgi:RimJ/RimL family protein N-acetyltransferase
MPEKPPAKLLSTRLLLRMPMMEDAFPIFELYAQDREVTRFLTFEPHHSIKVTKTFLERCLNNWKNNISFPWTIIRRRDKQLIGMIEIVNIEQSGIQLGYVLAKTFWGNGYMTEALRKIIEWSFTQDDIYRVWAVCDIENTASARVLEKVGMQKEGVLRRWAILPSFGDKPRDCFCYSIVQ